MDFEIKNRSLIGYHGDSRKIVIPEGVETLEDGVFLENQNIISVSFPGSLTRIGNRVFKSCHNLQEIRFSHMQHMNNGSWIFYDCPSLKKAYFPDWESFWNYNYDTVGPLENGTELYIDGQKVSVAIVTPNATDLRNLVGAYGIKEKRFSMKEDLVVVGYDHTITAPSLADEVFRENPGLARLFTIQDDANRLLNSSTDVFWKFIFDKALLTKPLVNNLNSRLRDVALEAGVPLSKAYKKRNGWLTPYNIQYLDKLIRGWCNCFSLGDDWMEKEQDIVDKINEFVGTSYTVQEWRQYMLNRVPQ
jgi:hypothetical protein